MHRAKVVRDRTSGYQISDIVIVSVTPGGLVVTMSVLDAAFTSARRGSGPPEFVLLPERGVACPNMGKICLGAWCGG